ncbi:MAG: tripartite tricarboxylate transporter substrate binding protein [Pigmentiphaga sp.]|nr:tripartite tricarboxylate transporter substrate binding protein [Pigmentiphaga sp.]
MNRKHSRIRPGRRTLIAGLAAILTSALALPASQALAQTDSWPSRPIQLIVPFPPGATADAFARTVAPHLSAALGQQVIVDNRQGAAGAIGSAHVAKAAPDGHTLLVTFATHYSLPFLQRSVPYDPVADFTPIIAAAKIHTVLAVHPSHPSTNLEEFIAHAKSAPDGIMYGSGGLLLFGELLAQAADIPMTEVPYKGGGMMLTDLLGGQIDTGLSILSSVIPHANEGRLRAIAVLSEQRAAAAPDIPAVSETVPDFEAQDNWVGVLAPMGLDPQIAGRIHAEIQRVLALPDVRQRMTDLGFEVTGDLSPAELQDSVRESVQTYRRITTNAGIVPR